MIKGLFYSEFDNVAGPVILFQAPENVLSNEVFDSVSGYIIIDKALCGKIITVRAQQMKIVGYPVCIEDDKYHRNALLFNIGFVFDELVETAPYRPILRKLGALVEGMEKESGFLYNADKKELLGTILPQILRDLTLHGECTIPVDTANIVNLKLFPTLQDPASVFEYQVPVAIRDLRALLENKWDLALQQIVPFIDGVRYVKRISLEADVEIAIVKKCVRQLLYYGCVTLIDIFLHSNIYANTPKISVLANDPKLQAECAVTSRNQVMRHRHSLGFSRYIARPAQFTHERLLCRVLESLALIDVRRFITFGLIHGFLRRVHRYPICIDRTLPGSSPPQQQQSQQPQQQTQQQQGGQQKGRPYALSTNSPSLSGMNPISAAPSSTQPGGVGANGGVNGNGAGASNGAGGNVASLTSSKRALVSKANQLEKDVLRMMDGGHHTDEICSKFLLRYTDVESTIQMTPNCFAVHK
ncbi:Nitrogen permease regulator 2 [Phytophthora cactorum]|nr:Nitrogen permease regulator 2 [Phytophthora cactorum]